MWTGIQITFPAEEEWGRGKDWPPVFQKAVGGPTYHATLCVWYLPCIYLAASCLSPGLCEISESSVFVIPVSTALRTAPSTSKYFDMS